VSALKVGGRPRALRFRLTAPAAVRVVLSVRSAGRWRRAGVRTVALPAGAHAVPAARSLLGLAVPAGSLRVTVTVAGRSASRTFRAG
jgi:hypothetical protein